MAPMISRLLFSVYVMLFLTLSAAVVHGGSGNGYPVSNEDGGGEFLSTMIGVQGIIYCKTGSKLTPIEGAVARVRCETRDEYGFEGDDVTVLSEATDAKGYFFATLSRWEVKEEMKIKECRAFLEVSPAEDCQFPTEINRGISGAILSSYRLLNRPRPMKLFTVGPFVFAPHESDDKSISNGY